MKNVFSLSSTLFIVFCTATIVFSSCDKDDEPKFVDPLTHDEGVVINGVKWATRNVGTSGTFVENSKDYGEYYQFNKGTTDFLSYEDYYCSIYPNSDFWLPTNDPSPVGWRVPTSDEIETLFDTEKVSKEWTILDGVEGISYTDKSTNKSLFLPAAGYYFDGTLYETGFGGFYWSNTTYDMYAPYYAYSWVFGLIHLGGNHDYDYGNRIYGQSVRSVAK